MRVEDIANPAAVEAEYNAPFARELAEGQARWKLKELRMEREVLIAGIRECVNKADAARIVKERYAREEQGWLEHEATARARLDEVNHELGSNL